MLPDRRSFLIAGGAAVAGLNTESANAQLADDEAKAFVRNHVKKIRPLEIAVAKAWWNANITGTDADFARKEERQNVLDAGLADKDTFEKLKRIRGYIKTATKDANLIRQIDVLYLQYLEKQVEPELLKKITAKANAVEQKFNVFRAKVGEKEMSDSQVWKVLKESTDSEEWQKVWEASTPRLNRSSN